MEAAGTATGIIATRHNREWLEALDVERLDDGKMMLFTEPGVGIYGPLRRLKRIKQPAGQTLVDRRAAAVVELRREFPSAGGYQLLDGDFTITSPEADEPLPAEPAAAPEPFRTVDLQVPGPDVFYQILIKSFRRFDCLLRLIRSVRACGYRAELLIADDSFQPGETPPPIVEHIKGLPGVRWYQMDFDAGLSAGRNLLVQESTAPLLINCDDDFVFLDGETRIENLIAVLDHEPNVGLVTGLVRWDGTTAMNYAGRFRFDESNPRHLAIRPLAGDWLTTPEGVRYRRTDLGFNYFCARRESLVTAPWGEFKISFEHLDHFLALKRCGIGVATTCDAIVGHLPDKNPDYLRYRARRNEYGPVFRAKWNLADLPNHRQVAEPGIADRDVRQVVRVQESAGRPNVVVLGVGHAGTSIVAKLLHRLGWAAGDADGTFGESVSIRALNDRLLAHDFCGSGEPPTAGEMAAALAAIPEPWCIKDPRFIHTLGQWLPALEQYRPALLWLSRDVEAVRGSYEKRRENPDGRGMALERKFAAAATLYRDWPGPKIEFDYETIDQALSLWRHPDAPFGRLCPTCGRAVRPPS